jgi:hypothetical protein
MRFPPPERRTVMNRPHFSYDEVEQTIFATHPKPIELSTRAEIAAYFDDALRFWRRSCGGRRVYVVVDYSNLTTNLDEVAFYSEQIGRIIAQCAITIVRHNGGLVQRTAGRMTAIQLHTPSNMYPDRESALAVVRGLRRGSIQPTK